MIGVDIDVAAVIDGCIFNFGSRFAFQLIADDIISRSRRKELILISNKARADRDI